MDENKNPESISVASKVKFKDVASLLEKIAKIDDATLTASSRGGQGKNDAKKTELESFMQTWRTIGDKMKAANSSSTRKVDENFFPVMRFLLPADDRRVYGLKEVKLAKALCDALCIGVRTDDGQKLINYRAPVHMKSSDGDFASVAYFVLKNRCQESNTLSVEEVNHYLNTISSNNAKGKEGQKEVNESIKHLLVNLSALQLKWLIRIILKDLKIGMKEATILDAYHPDAMDLYNFTSSLEKVCDTLNDPKKRLHEVGIELFSPCRPMLGERAKPNEIEKLMAGKSFYIETKFDGERFQLHMSRNQEAKSSDNTRKYIYFSRNGHDFTSTFGADVYSDGSLTPFIDKCFKAGCDSVILDGEMCGYNAREKYFLPLSDEYDVKSNKKVGEEIQTCFCVFDVLYFNGDVLTNKTLKERLEYMQKAFDEIDGRIVYSTREVASTNQNVVDALNKAIDSRLEGIVVKSPDSVYKPSVRSGSGWFKVKPDYMLGLNDDLDLLIVGGYYGVGRRSGLISHFLLAVAVVDDSSSSSSNKKPPKKTIDDDDELDFEGDDKPQTADESPVKQTPTLFYSFCKIGTGYSMKELHDFNQKLANKWTQFDKKAPPKHLQVTFERPDVWVEPKDSFIVQVKAVEICQSDKYKTGCTLKFPRLEKFRPDKAWHECMTLKELNDLREKNAGYLASGKHYALGGEEGEEDGDEPTKKKKKMSSTIKKLTVASNFRGIDASLVDRVGEAFDGKQFCVVVDEDYTKKTLVEKQIAELGGDIVQNPGVDTYCIVTSKITHRIQGYIRRNVYNIARLEWLQRCIADRTLHAWRPSDLIHATDAQQTRFSKLYDEYGDSFTEDTNLELLRALFDKMSSSPDYAVEQPSEDMYRRIAEIENEYYPDESAQFGLFRLCDVFVHPGVTPSRDLLMLRIRWKGGRISQAISPSTTHCIADKSDLKSLDELKKLNRSRERKIHIVSRDWVEQCIRDERQVNELSFHL